MAFCWIGLGSESPAWPTAFSNAPVMPSAAKPEISAVESVFVLFVFSVFKMLFFRQLFAARV